MSKTNAHCHHELEGNTLVFMKESLGPWQACRRPKCLGTMTSVFVRYENKGRVYHELECTVCGKVIKDPQWKIDRDKARENRKNWKKKPDYRGRYKGNNNASNNQRSRQ